MTLVQFIRGLEAYTPPFIKLLILFLWCAFLVLIILLIPKVIIRKNHWWYNIITDYLNPW